MLIVASVLATKTLPVLRLSGYLVYQLVVDILDSVASVVGLVLITLAATAWIAVTAIGFVRGKSFAGGSAVVWQVLQGAVGPASN